MARVIKPPSTYNEKATDTGAEWYDGPPPKPALYKGVVKKMLLSKVGDEQRIMVLCEISDGPYKGAGVTKWLQLTEQGSPWVNQFLRSLTDGSDEQFKAIRHAFKEVGYQVGDMDAKNRLPIIKIGKKTNPIGMSTAFMTKLRTGTDDVERAEISRFVVPKNLNGDEPEEDTDALDDADFANIVAEDADNAVDAEPDYEPSGIDEFAKPTTVQDLEDDDDPDPWS